MSVSNRIMPDPSAEWGGQEIHSDRKEMFVMPTAPFVMGHEYPQGNEMSDSLGGSRRAMPNGQIVSFLGMLLAYCMRALVYT